MARGMSSTAAGYGADHRRAAAALKAKLRRTGVVLCARGGEPLYSWQLDLHHHDPRAVHAEHLGTPRVYDPRGLPDSLSCAHHNTSHGARLGNQLRGTYGRAGRAGSRHPSRPSAQPLPEW